MLTEISFLSKKGWRSVAAVHRLRNRFAMAHIRRSASKPPRKPCPNRKNRRRTFMPSDTLTVQVERCIYSIRGEKVMLDYDLAVLYGVPTKSLNLAVKRNAERFQNDFMFRLTQAEEEGLRFQIGTSNEMAAKQTSGLRFQTETSKSRRGGRRYLPYAFTEQGVAMLSSVLRSQRAVQVNIAIMRTFVRLREMLLSNADLARKLGALEKKYDAQFKVVFDAIRELMTPPEKPKRQIGFHSYE